MTSEQPESEWKHFLEQLDFLPAHETLLSYLYFEGTRPASEAPVRAQSWAGNTCRTKQGIEEYQFAIDDLLNRDLFWVIDESKQSAIEQHIHAPAAIGPIDIMPAVDTLQFSVRLAVLMDEFWADASSDRPASVYSPHYLTDDSIDIYSNSPENCIQFVNESGMVRDDSIGRAWAPKRCGPWRDQWWRLYQSGFVLNVPAECTNAG